MVSEMLLLKVSVLFHQLVGSYLICSATPCYLNLISTKSFLGPYGPPCIEFNFLIAGKAGMRLMISAKFRIKRDDLRSWKDLLKGRGAISNRSP